MGSSEMNIYHREPGMPQFVRMVTPQPIQGDILCPVCGSSVHHLWGLKAGVGIVSQAISCPHGHASQELPLMPMVLIPNQYIQEN